MPLIELTLTLVLAYSIAYMRAEPHSNRFFAILNAFAASMHALITACSPILMLLG